MERASEEEEEEEEVELSFFLGTLNGLVVGRFVGEPTFLLLRSPLSSLSTFFLPPCSFSSPWLRRYAARPDRAALEISGSCIFGFVLFF